ERQPSPTSKQIENVLNELNEEQEQTEEGDQTEINPTQNVNANDGAGPSNQYIPKPQTVEETMDIIMRNLWTFMELRIRAYDRWVCAKFQTS
ncbi:hypothetical protein RF074_11630, partial [Serratia marcescens]|uniref:hypothetical protein n=1 Tax=Serratia marcescens TaxID=615 RepID=UPI0028137A76